MCGIAGLVDFAGVAAPDLDRRMARAMDRIRPRGPDAQAHWSDARCALLHSRLAIIDLSPDGNQPMHGHGGSIAYNGEIYNYRAVRAELQAAGYVFRTQSDTEVILAGWDAWGEALLPKLNGMFAFALWRPGEGKLALVRDRFGKKPLCYRHAPGRIGFGSDALAVAALAPGDDRLDRAALRLLLTLGYIPAPLTVYDDVRKLPPGHLAIVAADGLAVRRWYRLADHVEATDADADPARVDAELRARFDAAVTARLVADVPVAAFLSGGIDSALVAASLAHQGHAVETFTVGFADAPAYYEERPAARAVARHLGLAHHELELSADAALDGLDAVIGAMDEPFADSSAIPTFHLSRAMAAHVKVALSGDGADEVFGGYRKYQGELHAARYGRLPAGLRKAVVEPLVGALPESKQRGLMEKARRLRKFVAHAGKPLAERQAAWASLLPAAEVDGLLGAAGPDPVAALVAARHREVPACDALNRVLYADIGLVLPDDMLVKVDRMGMAHGLEVRSPFLDPAVVELAMALPGADKVRPGAGKYVLRRAFADRLPAEVFARPKKGFEAPVARWLAGPWRDRALAATEPAFLRRLGFADAATPRRWLDDLAAGRRDTAGPLWTLMVLHGWSAANRLAS
ncbi:MAG: asparagine synthase (glutamine-hydrolyzing) [Alphaproteobacteria bacterium]